MSLPSLGSQRRTVDQKAVGLDDGKTAIAHIMAERDKDRLMSPKDIDAITGYHAHVYYDAECRTERDLARQ